MMNVFINSTFFGIFLSLAVYLIGMFLFKISRKFFLFTPLFVAMMLGAFILHANNISYEQYKKGGDIILFFLGPATVAFAIPLYKMVLILKKYFVQIFLSIAAGSFVSVIAVFIIAHIFNISEALMKSILPQAATTAIALPIAGQIGGIEPITAYAVILNAAIIFGTGSFFLTLSRVKNPVAKGIAMGTAGHGLGVARSLELGPVEAAMASIAVVVVGVVTVFVVPIFLKLVGITF